LIDRRKKGVPNSKVGWLNTSRPEGKGEMIRPKNPIKPKRKALKTKSRLKRADTHSIKNLGKPVKRR
jgi:hypothetical protein